MTVTALARAANSTILLADTTMVLEGQGAGGGPAFGITDKLWQLNSSEWVAAMGNGLIFDALALLAEWCRKKGTPLRLDDVQHQGWLATAVGKLDQVLATCGNNAGFNGSRLYVVRRESALRIKFDRTAAFTYAAHPRTFAAGAAITSYGGTEEDCPIDGADTPAAVRERLVAGLLARQRALRLAAVAVPPGPRDSLPYELQAAGFSWVVIPDDAAAEIREASAYADPTEALCHSRLDVRAPALLGHGNFRWSPL